MPWLAAAIPALGALGSAGASAYGASQGDEINTQKIQAPGWARGLQHMFSRAIAQNAFNTAPSFGDFISSGGAARFPINFTGMTPQESRLLDFVGPAGEPIPYTDVARVGRDQPPGELTPEQRMFLGSADIRSGREGPLNNLMRTYQRYQALEEKSKDPYITETRKSRLERRMARTGSKFEDRFNAIMRRGHGTGTEYTGDPGYNVPDKAPGEGVRPGYGRSTGRGRSGSDYDRLNQRPSRYRR